MFTETELPVTTCYVRCGKAFTSDGSIDYFRQLEYGCQPGEAETP